MNVNQEENMQEGYMMQGVGMIIVMCAAGICIINMLMERAAFGGEVGLNPVTLLTTTILGFPGLAALYGIKIMSIL